MRYNHAPESDLRERQTTRQAIMGFVAALPRDHQALIGQMAEEYGWTPYAIVAHALDRQIEDWLGARQNGALVRLRAYSEATLKPAGAVPCPRYRSHRGFGIAT